jgi:hypothetical protein
MALLVTIVVTMSVDYLSTTALAAPPANDNFASAAFLSIPSAVSGTTTEATTETGEPGTLVGCRNPAGQVEPTFSFGKTVWYRFQPSVGARTFITLAGPNTSATFDTTVAVYTGTSLSNLVVRACNDDLTPTSMTPSTRRSGVVLNVTAGTTYYIQVGGYGGGQPSFGNFQLQLAQNTTPAPGNCFSNRNNFFSIACVTGASGYRGVRAAHQGAALNTSQDASNGGSYVSEAIWFYDNWSGAAPWLEVGDTAGGGQIQGHENAWERWWYWVDGRGTYAEFPIAPANRNPALRYHFIIQREDNGTWSILICDAADNCGNVVPNLSWATTNTDQRLVVGMEDNGLTLNNNTNTGSPIETFEHDTMSLKLSNGLWASWPHVNTPTQIDAGCGFSFNPPPFCLNGAWANPGAPWDNWRNNKP